MQCELIYIKSLPVPRAISDHYGVPPEHYWRNADYASALGYF